MTNLKKALLFALLATVAVAALAFAQANKKNEAAAPTVGALAPAYALPDQNGQTHTLVADKGKVILLAFYPADFTGGCTLEAHSLTSAYKDLKAEGVTVYGVSVQDSKSHQSFCSKEGIPYTLLADTEKKMSADYGVLLPGVGIANRVTFIIGADGKVAYVDKAVNSHLMTCGADWVAWVKAHPAIRTALTKPSAYPAADDHNFSSSETVTASLTLKTTGPAVIGQAAPYFALPNVITGQHSSIATFVMENKAVVVMFISTRCPVSNAYNGRIAALTNKYVPQGVAFVGIDSNTTEPTAEIAAFVKQHSFGCPVLKDANDKAADAYNAHVTPETYVIDKNGILRYHGRIDNDMDAANVKTHELASALDAVLAGKPVARAEAKAFGCSIKRG